jgi:hypothetical protein
MSEIDLIFTFTLLGCCYFILTQPGEMLQKFARYVNMSKLPEWLKKLIICPYCSLVWVSMIVAYIEGLNVLIVGCSTMILIYVFVKVFK